MLANPSPDVGQLFGFSLGIAPGAILVGTPFYDAQALGSGASHLFEAGSGALLRSFRNPRPEDYDLFGQAHAAIGDQLLIGAPFDDTAAANAGAVYLFDPARRTPVHSFTSPNPHAGDFFGTALAAVGSLVLVGAPFDDTAEPDAGAAYLFDAATGALVRSLFDPAPSADGRFGSAVATLGTSVLVGAPFSDVAAPDGGVAYLFDAASGELLETFHNPTAGAGDQFGATLAAAGTDVVVGAWLDDTVGLNAGALHVFRDTALPPPTTTSTLPPTTVTSTSTTSTTTDGLPGDTTTTTTTTVTLGPTTTADDITTTITTTTTTTVSLPIPPRQPCDDGDPCTVDGVDAGVCVPVPLLGLEAAICRLWMLDAALHDAPARALGGRRLLARLRLRVALGRRLLSAARFDEGRRAAARVRKATRAIGKFIAAVERAERRGRIPPAPAGNLVALAAAALDPL
jgi:hypothetical protein